MLLFPTSISLLSSRVGALVAHSQDDLNLLFCLHLNTGSLRSFNSRLRSLKLIILIFTIDAQVTSAIEAIQG